MESSSKPLQRPRKPLWFLACLAILAAGIGAFVLLRALRPAPEQRDPVELIPLVEVAPLLYRDSPLLIEGNGIVTPRANTLVSSQVSGEVVEVHPNLVTGGAFNAGDVIVRIDPRSFEASLREAEAAQDANRSNLAFLERQVERLQSLREGNYTGEETLEDAINRRDQTLAAIARQEAVIVNRRLDLERATIRAPFDGRVISEDVNLGDVVAPGRELARFYASDEVEVVVGLNPDDSRFVPGLWEREKSEGQRRRAWVTVEHGGRRYQWPGYVHRVEADIDRTSRTVDVVVRVPDPFRHGTPLGESTASVPTEAPPLLVGMYAGVEIEGLELAEHFVLPVSAVRRDDTIWTVTPEGRLTIAPVEFVRQEGNMAVLLAPQLEEGTAIITSDIALVSDGMRVQVDAGAAN